MTDSLEPIGPARPSRGAARREQDADADTPASADTGALVASHAADASIDPGAGSRTAPKARRLGFAAFAAQLLGGGQKRGLRGGQETLERARASYLETEWSGPSDRRLRTGRITKTEV